MTRGARCRHRCRTAVARGKQQAAPGCAGARQTATAGGIHSCPSSMLLYSAVVSIHMMTMIIQQTDTPTFAQQCTYFSICSVHVPVSQDTHTHTQNVQKTVDCHTSHYPATLCYRKVSLKFAFKVPSWGLTLGGLPPQAEHETISIPTVVLRHCYTSAHTIPTDPALAQNAHMVAEHIIV